MNKEKPNLKYINDLSRGDKEFERKLINIIKTEFPKEEKAYHNHLDTNEHLLAADLVHKLKHKISILGLERSYQIAKGHENNLRNNKLDLEEDFNDVLGIISNYLATL